MLPGSTTNGRRANPRKPTEILIVEDDEMIAGILQRRLEKLGYVVSCTSTSGEEALVKVRKFRPMLVLMDVVLEGRMDGIEAAHRIRQEFDIPVVYLTSHTDEDTLQRATLTSPFGYIVKPFESGELRAAIEIALYRHKADQQLRKMERWLATTLRSIGDGVITTDKNGRITMLNAVAETLTGWKQTDALGQPFDKVFKAIKEKTREPIESPALRSLREGMTVNLEEDTLLITKDGREIPIDDSAAPIRDDAEKVVGAVVVFRDGSQRRNANASIKTLNDELENRVRQRTQQLEAANRELEAFTYSVSHDLTGPIRAIDGFASALAEDYGAVLDEEGKQFLNLVRQNTGRMGQMVNDFLRLSRVENTELQLRKTDMAALVREVMADPAVDAGPGEYKIEFGALPGACCDASLIRQVWANLFSNALKYSKSRKVARIVISGEIKKGETVYCVKDNGVGFDMKQADKLFGVFQRLHSGKEFEGNGVGLAIVRRIVLRHGGRVWATSKVNKGSAFYFTLPVRQPKSA
ncbi:MAG: hypothetical protein JWM68_1586 [Verrucomicrobiales bacterium]|nr:hypothetical protein [Verrucomicrobiales bacterium]